MKKSLIMPSQGVAGSEPNRHDQLATDQLSIQEYKEALCKLLGFGGCRFVYTEIIPGEHNSVSIHVDNRPRFAVRGFREAYGSTHQLSVQPGILFLENGDEIL